MPTLARFGSVTVRMFAADHNPPHIHLDSPDGKVLVEIGTWRVMAGRWHRDLAEALAWTRRNEALLRARWMELNP